MRHKPSRTRTILLIALWCLSPLLPFHGGSVAAAGLEDWTRSVSLSRQNKIGGTVLWGSLELRDRSDLGHGFFHDHELGAFALWIQERDSLSPGLGYRSALGYRRGEFAIHAAVGLARLHDADKVPGLSNATVHVSLRAGVSYQRFTVILDHLSERNEDDRGITTLGLAISF